MILFRILLPTFLLLASVVAHGAPKLPDWLQEAIRRPTDAVKISPRDDSVILHDERIVEFHPNGRQTTHSFFARKILTVDGRYHGSITLGFAKGEEAVKSLDAWLITPDGEVTAFRKKDFTESEGGPAAVYSTQRLLRLGLEAKAVPGSVIAYSSTNQAKTVFLDDRFVTQGSSPIVYQRYEVRLPKDWTIQKYLLREPAVQSEDEAEGRWAWTILNQPALPANEYRGPSFADRSPLIAIQAFPAASSRKTPYAVLQTWNDNARYEANVADAAAVPNDDVRAKAAALTKDAATPWDQLKALASFVQSVNYVSVEIDILKGGGLKPFDAPEVLRRHYGDCKDKSALMRALAQSLGFKSYVVGVRGGGYGDVLPEWPSLAQFNHAIVAIEVGDDVQCPAILEHPQLGRLLIFDPTDEITPIGRLAFNYSGDYMLIVHPGEQGLVTAPPQPPPAIEELLQLQLLENGTVAGVLTTRYRNDAATTRRDEKRTVSEADYQRSLQRMVAAVSPRGRASLAYYNDDFEQNVIEERIELYLDGYARSLGKDLLALKPNPFLRYDWRPSAADVRDRALPFVSRQAQYTQQVLIAVPEGFAPESLPERQVIRSPFSNFVMEFRFADRVIDVRHASIFKDEVIPAEGFQAVGEFFDNRARTAGTTLVLRRDPEAE